MVHAHAACAAWPARWLRPVVGDLAKVAPHPSREALRRSLGARALRGLFLFAGATAIIGDVYRNFDCRSALASGRTETVQGTLTIQERPRRRGGAGIVSFSIDGRLRTGWRYSTECGLVRPLGQKIYELENKRVRATVAGTKVLELELLE